MAADARLIHWLLASDEPSVRLRVLTELLGRGPTDPEVLAATEALGTTGWGAEILTRQLPEGHWDSPGTTRRDLYTPKYIATNWKLIVLADLGLTRAHPQVARAAELFLAVEGAPDGELGGPDSEVCFTGNAVRALSRLGYGDDPRVASAIAWLLDAQKEDGGWHCFPSATGTLDGWEALAAFAALPRARWTDRLRRSVEAGAEFYLSRGLLHEGAEYAPWTRLHYPVHYYYDVLVGLGMLTELGYGADPRLGPALDLLESKRDSEGRWSAEASHPDLPVDEEYQVRTPHYPFVLEPAGRPSRWITLNALAVLRKAGRG